MKEEFTYKSLATKSISASDLGSLSLDNTPASKIKPISKSDSFSTFEDYKKTDSSHVIMNKLFQEKIQNILANQKSRLLLKSPVSVNRITPVSYSPVPFNATFNSVASTPTRRFLTSLPGVSKSTIKTVNAFMVDSAFDGSEQSIACLSTNKI